MKYQYPGRTDLNDQLPAAETPTNCPTCRSQNVTTTSKVVSTATYWRCGACGDVWNVERRRDGSRSSYRRT